ncbi:MAG: hypothetical protein C5B50_08075 [Verrucomicrobia bacterium]|nr:MAG: hypothetical protein C5B50_08075 [Verrucomicrobiota bacterium]
MNCQLPNANCQLKTPSLNPVGMKENSPALQRWERYRKWAKSRRDDRNLRFSAVPVGTYASPRHKPSVETLGYYLPSLRDFAKVRLAIGHCQLAILICLFFLYPFVTLADDTVTIPKSRLEELERKEAELQRLKRGVAPTNAPAHTQQAPVTPAPRANQKPNTEKPAPPPPAEIPSATTARYAPPPIPKIESLPPLKEGEVVEATDLALHYLANPVVADKRYLKHTVTVRGEIERFNKFLVVRYCEIILYTPDRRMTVVCNFFEAGHFKSVFIGQHGSELVGLTAAEARVPIAKVGQVVTIRGTCDGLDGPVVNISGAIIVGKVKTDQ